MLQYQSNILTLVIKNKPVGGKPEVKGMSKGLPYAEAQFASIFT